jgi:hypothetical protein
MKKILVVDAKANQVCSDLSSVLNPSSGLEFIPVDSIPVMIDAISAKEKPAGILLHHNWDAFKVSELLEKMFNLSPSSFVVVYTGRALKLDEIVQCVRGGVADYLILGGVDLRALVDRLYYYSSVSSLSLEKLRMPASSVSLLLDSATQLDTDCKVYEAENKKLRDQLREEKSKSNKALLAEVLLIGKSVIYIACLVVALMVCKNFVVDDILFLSGVLLICALFVLFCDKAISRVIFRHGKTTAEVK